MNESETIDTLIRIQAVKHILYSIPTVENVVDDKEELVRLAEMLPHTINRVINLLQGNQ